MYANLSDDESSNLIDRETMIYRNYSNVVQELVPAVESRTSEFPKYINVELRSLFTHMARARAKGLSYQEKQKHITGAERHLNRMIRDLYKDLCGLIAETATIFLENNKDAILLIGEQGQYLHQALESERNARNVFLDAKTLDTNGCLTEQDEADLFGKYQDAYVSYCEFEELLTSKEAEILEKAAVLMDRATKPTKKWTIISIIASLILAIIFFCLGKLT